MAVRDASISGLPHVKTIRSSGPSRSIPAHLSTVRPMMDRPRCPKTGKHSISSQTVTEDSAGETSISHAEPLSKGGKLIAAERSRLRPGDKQWDLLRFAFSGSFEHFEGAVEISERRIVHRRAIREGDRPD